MILTALIWVAAQAGYAIEGAVDVVVPDSVLGIIRTALNGTGTDLVKAATYRFTTNTLKFVAASIDILFLLFFARLAIRAAKRIRSWLP